MRPASNCASFWWSWDMSEYFTPLNVGNNITELPKSTLPASAEDNAGHYPFFCSSAEVKATTTWLQERPTVLMGTGGVASVNYGEDRFAYSTDTWGFRSNNAKLATKFLFRKIQQHLPRIDYAGFEGSGLRHLRKDFVKKLKIDVPSPTVQSKIVEILDSHDCAIEKTEALIAKYQQIKAGLMHNLFTRGVTADGKLRPPREQAPELYYETPIGWIPKAWGCKTLEELLASVGNNFRSGPFGSALLKSELVENGIPFLGIDNVHAEHFEATFRRFVSLSKFSALNRYAVRPKDVVITIMGTVGRCCVLPEDICEALSSKHLWTMTFDQSQVIPELICWQLNYAPWVLSWFKRRAQGAVMDAIQSSTLKTLRLPVPLMSEQQEIFKKYAECNSKIDSEQANLRKLQMEKLGLMHDLLTGKVRVNPDTVPA